MFNLTNVCWLRWILLHNLKQLLHVVGLDLLVVALEFVVGPTQLALRGPFFSVLHTKILRTESSQYLLSDHPVHNWAL